MDHGHRLFLAIVSVGVTASCSAGVQTHSKTGAAQPARADAQPLVFENGQRNLTPAAAAPVASEMALRSQEAPERAPTTPSAAGEQPRLERAALVQAVLRRNPTLAARKRVYQAARAQERRVTALDDPMLSYSLAPLSIASDDVSFGQVIQLSQRFPWPGKLSSRGEAASAHALAAKEEIEVTELELAFVACALLDSYYYVDQALEINRDHQNLVRDLKRSAEVQYSVGKGSLQDPLQAEVQLSHLIHEQVVLGAEREVIQAQLNALLHYPQARPVPPPPQQLAVPLDWPPQETHEASLRRQALARAEFRAAQARIRAADAETAAAEREYYPDFSVMASYSSMWAMPEHQWMVGIQAPIPIQLGRRAGSVQQAEAAAARARSELHALKDDVLRDVRVSAVKVNEAQHVVHLYRSRLIPAARDQVAAASSGYQAGTNSFVAVIEAEKNLRSVRLAYVKAVATLSTQMANLQRELGQMPGLRDSHNQTNNRASK